jgi:3-hydroxyisobutyrate dehydrogenase/2-hydroxy-3-oxopropionate reductase
MDTRVAVAGLGRMGSAMSKRLVESGATVVVTNRTPARAEALASDLGIEWRRTAAEAVADAEVVVSCVADDAAVLDSYSGEAGIAAGLTPGTVVLEMSTIDPATVAAVRAPVEAAGGELVDAPVSGSVPLVIEGKLTVMAGGSADAIERARPVLDALAAKVFHLGGSGTGATMKLAVNSMVHAINVALSEALVLAERSGVARDLAYDVIAAGVAGSPFVAYKRSAFLDPDNTPVAFSLDLVAKDLDLILGLADRVGAEMVQGAASRALVGAALEAGLGARDMSVVAEYLRA